MKLDAHHERAVAVAAACDPKSVRRYLAGAATRPLVRERIEKALKEMGKGDLVQGEAAIRRKK